MCSLGMDQIAGVNLFVAMDNLADVLQCLKTSSKRVGG